MSIALREFGRASDNGLARQSWEIAERKYRESCESDKAQWSACLDDAWVTGGSHVASLDPKDHLAHSGTISDCSDLCARPIFLCSSLKGCSRQLSRGDLPDQVQRCVTVAVPRRRLHLAVMPNGLSWLKDDGLAMEHLLMLRAVKDWCEAKGVAGCSCPALSEILIASPLEMIEIAGFLMPEDVARAVAENK